MRHTGTYITLGQIDYFIPHRLPPADPPFTLSNEMGYMRRGQSFHPRQRFAHRSHCLLRQSGNQVNVDVGNAAVSQQSNVALYDSRLCRRPVWRSSFVTKD